MPRTEINTQANKSDPGPTIISPEHSQREQFSGDTKIEQKPDILDRDDYDGDVILVDPDILKKEYQDELRFNEEPVTIRIEPSSEKNAAAHYPIWNNGKGAEVFQNGKWMEIGYLPVGRLLIVKRKVLAILVGSKIDRIETVVEEKHDQDPDNKIRRFTSPVHSFSVLEDKNPRGGAWLTELVRRNF